MPKKSSSKKQTSAKSRTKSTKIVKRSTKTKASKNAYDYSQYTFWNRPYLLRSQEECYRRHPSLKKLIALLLVAFFIALFLLYTTGNIRWEVVYTI